RDKRAALQAADEALHELRVLLRQGQALQLMTLSQYEHVARLVDEVGRLLGGWRKSLARAATAGGEAEGDAPPPLPRRGEGAGGCAGVPGGGGGGRGVRGEYMEGLSRRRIPVSGAKRCGARNRNHPDNNNDNNGFRVVLAHRWHWHYPPRHPGGARPRQAANT